jgi:hypothetical protein
MVMLGAYNALTKQRPGGAGSGAVPNWMALRPISLESLVYALRATLGKEKERLIPINQKAMEAGARCV